MPLPPGLAREKPTQGEPPATSTRRRRGQDRRSHSSRKHSASVRAKTEPSTPCASLAEETKKLGRERRTRRSFRHRGSVSKHMTSVLRAARSERPQASKALPRPSMPVKRSRMRYSADSRASGAMSRTVLTAEPLGLAAGGGRPMGEERREDGRGFGLRGSATELTAPSSGGTEEGRRHS